MADLYFLVYRLVEEEGTLLGFKKTPLLNAYERSPLDMGSIATLKPEEWVSNSLPVERFYGKLQPATYVLRTRYRVLPKSELATVRGVTPTYFEEDVLYLEVAATGVEADK